MPGVDLTGILQEHFWDAKKRYENSKKLGDYGKAAEEALKCSEYMILLAKEIPFQKKHYEELALLYKQEAERLLGLSKQIRSRVVKESLTSEIASMDREFEDEVRKLITKANINWDDIAGLEETKRLLKEIVFFSVARPDKPISISPPKRILLYGPPGTGKTMLAMAASSNLGATFFNTSIDRLLSRYVGDSPRLVSALFRVARAQTPSLIFIDEIEALVARREERDIAIGVVQTFLTELDGFVSKAQNLPLMVMVATNKPWMIDEAILSRFDKRIYTPLPDDESREQIFRLHLEKRGFEVEFDYQELSNMTKGYNGREIMIACENAKMMMLRRANPNVHELVGGEVNTLLNARYRVLPIEREEIIGAINKVKPIVDEGMINKFEKWRMSYGSE